jgi:uncharacterized membrane protein
MFALELLMAYAFGAFGYGLLEILWRGYTHWTMALTGGLCFALLYIIATRSHEKLWKKWIMGAAVITTIEFVVGTTVNILLGWEVWDYSDRSFNLMGQICLVFSLLWFMLCIFCMPLCKMIRLKWFPGRDDR